MMMILSTNASNASARVQCATNETMPFEFSSFGASFPPPAGAWWSTYSRQMHSKRRSLKLAKSFWFAIASETLRTSILVRIKARARKKKTWKGRDTFVPWNCTHNIRIASAVSANIRRSILCTTRTFYLTFFFSLNFHWNIFQDNKNKQARQSLHHSGSSSVKLN